MWRERPRRYMDDAPVLHDDASVDDLVIGREDSGSSQHLQHGLDSRPYDTIRTPSPTSPTEAQARMAAQLVPLSRQKVAEASRSLAAAFFDDPTSRFLLPREESRDRWLRLIHH